MVTCYSQEFSDSHDIIDKSFFTGGNINAKKERDTLARRLRKDGYTVETKKYHFDTKDSFTLHAVKELRPKTIEFQNRIKSLEDEYLKLRKDIFDTSMFVVVDENSEESKRYNQLFCFFNPSFRTARWINPMEE